MPTTYFNVINPSDDLVIVAGNYGVDKFLANQTKTNLVLTNEQIALYVSNGLLVLKSSLDNTVVSPPSWGVLQDWAPNTVYQVSPPTSLVRHDSTIYLCSVNHTSSNTFDDTKFTVLIPQTRLAQYRTLSYVFQQKFAGEPDSAWTTVIDFTNLFSGINGTLTSLQDNITNMYSKFKNMKNNRIVFSAASNNLNNNQTNFSIPGGYTTGFVEVYLNGYHLVTETDYLATNGSDLIMAQGIPSNAVLDVVAYKFETVAPI